MRLSGSFSGSARSEDDSKLDNLDLIGTFSTQDLRNSLDIIRENTNVPMFRAVFDNNLSKLQNILQQGLAEDGAVETDCISALHCAAFEGRLEAVKCLIEGGANINFKDDRCETPLIYAIRGNRTEVFMELLRNGADVNIYGQELQSPLHLACALGNAKMVSELISVLRPGQISAPDTYGQTPLHAAVIMGHEDIVSSLIDAGADVKAMDDGERTPIQIAEALRDFDIEILLIDAGARPEEMLPEKEVKQVEKALSSTALTTAKDVKTKAKVSTAKLKTKKSRVKKKEKSVEHSM